MITLSKIDNAIRFTFANSQHYLTGDGTIDVPVNSLSLIFDESDFATFRKAASNDIFVSAPISEFGMSKAQLEDFYKENMVGSSGGGISPEEAAAFVHSAEYVTSAHTIVLKNTDGDVLSTIDATDFIKDGMVSNVEIANNNLVITFNTDSGKQPISIPLTSFFDASNYYTKAEIDENEQVLSQAINVLNQNKANISAVTEAVDALSGAIPTQYVRQLRADSYEGLIRNYTAENSDGTYRPVINNFSINGRLPLSRQNGTYSDFDNFNLVETSAFTAYSAATETALNNKADISDLEDAEQVIAQSINVLNNTKQDKLQYITEDTEGGFVDVNIYIENNYYGATMGGGAITFITSNLNDESYTGNTLGETQIDINSTAINIIGTTKTYDAENQEWVEELGNHEVQSFEDGLYIDGEKVITESDYDEAQKVTALALNDLNSRKLDASAYTPVDLSEYYTSAQTQTAIDNVKAFYIDFGVASVQGLTDAEWDAGIAAYQAHRPIYAKLLTNWYVCTDVIYNGTDTLIISASDSNSNYKYTVVKVASNQYSISTEVNPVITAAEKASYDGAVTALGGMSLVKLTQAQYDALATKDPNTLYIISNVVNNA